MQIITPAGNTDPALAGARLAVKAAARNAAAAGAPAQEVSLRMSVPAGAGYENAIPTPTHAQAQQVQWDVHLAPDQSGAGEITVILPQTSADLPLQISLLDTVSEGLLDSQILPIHVLGLDTLIPRVQAGLSALSTSSAQTQALIDQARHDAAVAQAAQSAQTPDWDAALTALARVQAALMQLAQPPHSLSLDPLTLDVARWIGLAQSHWQASDNTAAAQVLAHAGDGQSVAVNTPFAAPLVAQVLDAQGAPVAGVVVHFQLPVVGASAQFAEGAQSADAATDAQGLATSPALTANAIAGSYQASARVDDVEQAAGFALTNQSMGGSMIVVSGAAQTARIGADFAAPIVAQVLDAQGQGMPGISVTIMFATSGASASFPGGARNITLTSNAQGMVASPIFTANDVPGAHQASVTAMGIDSLVIVALNNLAQTSAFSLQLIQGDNQSAPVGQLYGLGIKVPVVDAQGTPQAGVTVVFSMPVSGPSGSFDGGQTTVSVVTGADGVALSPLPVANEVQGSFQVVATAKGAAQPARVHLTNLPPADSGEAFTGTIAVPTSTLSPWVLALLAAILGLAAARGSRRRRV